MPTLTLTPPQGWQCPACGGVYAPWVAKCTECKPKTMCDRMADAQPTAPAAPAQPYVPPHTHPAPCIPNPYAWPSPPWPNPGIVWCDTATHPDATHWLELTPEARARMTACCGGSAYTLTFNHGANYEAQPERGDDDGTAGVPARI